jgi:hypothetical protein
VSTPLTSDSVRKPTIGGPALRKQPPNVYTVMLIVSVLFMLIAVVAMVIELRRYAPEYSTTSTARPNVSAQSVSSAVAAFRCLG